MPLQPSPATLCKICMWPCKIFFSHPRFSYFLAFFFSPTPTHKTEKTGIGKWGGRLLIGAHLDQPIKLSTQLETRNSQERLIWLPLLCAPFWGSQQSLSSTGIRLMNLIQDFRVITYSTLVGRCDLFDWWTSSKISGSYTEHWLEMWPFDWWTSSKISGSYTEHWWRCSLGHVIRPRSLRTI